MKKVFIPIVLAIAVIVGVLIGHIYAKRGINDAVIGSITKIVDKSNKLSDVVEIIDRYYVDDIDKDSLIEEVIPSLLAQLDPHTMYISAKDIKIAEEELAGSFWGIGIQFNLYKDTIQVINVVQGGPSEKVGILAGDKIITVDDSIFAGKKISNKDILSTLRGDEGSKVKLGVKRSNSDEILEYTITRGVIPVKSVDVAYMIDEFIGYISVNKFANNTYAEFLNALTMLKKNGAKSLIIDLRGNAGGYLEAAVDMLNEFLLKGEMIVYIEGAHKKRVDSYADGTGSFQNIPLVILIDEFSGSASEIFAGAIQDNDRGTIIGRRSFGKGLVQSPIRLNDDSEIRLTVAKYYTPSGRCIQKPYHKGDNMDYEMDLINRFNNGEFYSKDSIKEDTTEVYYTRNGRKVYGGGGIMPDIFVPTDTSFNSSYLTSIINKGITYQFAIQYTDNNRAKLLKYKTLDELQKYLEGENIFPEIVKFGKNNGVVGDAKDKAKSKIFIERQTIAYIIRNILDQEGFIPYINQNDDCVRKALVELSK